MQSTSVFCFVCLVYIFFHQHFFSFFFYFATVTTLTAIYFSLCIFFIVLFCFVYILLSPLHFQGLNSGGSRNFKTGGSGPGAIEFLGSEVYFDAPFTHTLCFLVRVENREHIVKYSRIIQSKFTKTNPKKIQTGGRAPDAPVLDLPFGSRWIKIDKDYLIGLCTFLSFYETKSKYKF